MLLGFKLSRAIVKIFNGHLVRRPAVPSFQVTFTLALRCISSRSPCVIASTLCFTCNFHWGSNPTNNLCSSGISSHLPLPAVVIEYQLRLIGAFFHLQHSFFTLQYYRAVAERLHLISPLPPALEDDGFRARDCGPRENVRELRTGRYGIVSETQLQ